MGETSRLDQNQEKQLRASALKRPVTKKEPEREKEWEKKINKQGAH